MIVRAHLMKNYSRVTLSSQNDGRRNQKVGTNDANVPVLGTLESVAEFGGNE